MNLEYKKVVLFSKAELKRLREIIDSSEQWHDGTKSTVGITESTKKNKENWFDPKVEQIKDIIADRYLESHHVNSFITIQSATHPIISQTSPGGYYKPHIDRPESGHYSTTLFLSEPDEYEGGELVLGIAGSHIKVKLKAGEAIVYKSGTPHCVQEVTSGKRLVAVSWLKSKITDQCDREILYMLRVLKEKIEEKNSQIFVKENYSSLKDAELDPGFIYKNIKHRIQSKYPITLESDITRN